MTACSLTAVRWSDVAVGRHERLKPVGDDLHHPATGLDGAQPRLDAICWVCRMVPV